MSKSNYYESQLIEATFGSGAISPDSALHVSLHTADPTEAGNQSSSEATFTGYARQLITGPAGWTTGQDNAVNANDIVFPEASAGSELITHVAVGADLAGAGNILYFGPLSSSVQVDPGVSVKINAGNLVITEA